MSSKLYIKFTPPDQVILPYEPETTAYMNNADVNIPDDATVYFSATAYQITGAELWTALDAFVVALKTSLGLTLKQNNLSTKFKFIYPRIGGTATAHRINLVDPTTFIGTFSGGWTHDGSGALPNGTNGYMDTGCYYNDTTFTQNSQTFGFVSKTNSSGLYVDFGTTANGSACVLMYAKNGANMTTRLSDSPNNSVAMANSIGHFCMTRNGSANYKRFEDGTLIDTVTSTSIALSTVSTSPILINEAAANNGSPIQYSDRKRTLFYGGLGITDGQVTDLYNAWNTLETTLNR